MTKKGFYWHVHHSILVEFCYDYDERVRAIRVFKPKNEKPIRLKWFTPVKGKLPKDLVDAGIAEEKARTTHEKAYSLLLKYGTTKRAAALHEAEKNVSNAYFACATLIREHKDFLEKLHKKEHPDCPWNGKTLVFEEMEK